MSDYRNAAGIARDEASDRAFVDKLLGNETKDTCVVCESNLDDKDDDRRHRVCWVCKTRPEGKRIIAGAAAPRAHAEAAPSTRPVAPSPPASRPKPLSRAFTVADKALIKSLSPHLPAADVLRILNERLEADAPACAPYTLEQLRTEVAAASTSASSAWSDLRRLLTDAKRAGVLERIDADVIDAFAVVFQLVPAQVTQLKDVIAHAKEGQ